jgi:dihydroneopterin aldolase
MGTTKAKTGDRLLLNEMSFYGHHGVREEEQRLGQRFVVDAELWLDLQAAGRADDLESTVNYTSVYRAVEEIVEGPPRRLIESVAEAIAATLLSRFAPLQAVSVTVKKPWAPVAGSHLGFVAAEVFRQRS